MRDLTPEELALAPEWACKYFIDDNNKVVYSDKNSTTVGCGKHTFPASIYGKMSVQHLFRSINRKPFDITQHEWSDNAYGESTAYGNDKRLNINDGVDNSLSFNKKDAIAIAKHFKLTQEDLK